MKIQANSTEKGVSNGNDHNAFAVTLVHHSGTLRAKAFLLHIGWAGRSRETLTATWSEKEKMFEASLPDGEAGEAGPRLEVTVGSGKRRKDH